MPKATKAVKKLSKNDIAGIVLRCFIVFIVPIITGIIIFKKKEISPFGKDDVLSVDLWGQYFPMYRKFALDHGFAEAMYNWSGALGFNNWLQNAFYTRSIFLIPFCIIPFAKSITYIDIVCLLRFGLGAVACQLFLEYKLKSKSPVIMAASIGYGLCAYSTAFIMQFMWTDGLFLGPLVLLGLERLMNGKSPFMYVCLLALSIYSNFYTGFGICLFTGFYFLAEWLKRDYSGSEGKLPGKNGAIRARASMFGRFSLYSVLGGTLTAFLLVPTLMGLSNTESANQVKFDFTCWYHTLAENVAAMMPDTPASLEFGVANIALGLFAFILIPLYFMNTEIKFKEKLITGGFLAVLYSGLNYNPMDWLFNGFHFPNQLPGRWSFLFSFAVVIVAASGAARTKGINFRSIVSSLIIALFFLSYAKHADLPEQKLEKLTYWKELTIMYAMLLLASVMVGQLAVQLGKKAEKLIDAKDGKEPSETDSEKAALLKKKSRALRFCSLAISVVLAASITEELCRDTVRITAKEDGGMPKSAMESYIKVSDVLHEFGSKYDCGSDDLYRVEVNNGWTFNSAMLGDFKGIGYYGSTLNKNVYDLFRGMGNRIYAQNVSIVYNNSSLFQNSFFGIKYIIDRGKSFTEMTGKGYVITEDAENAVILENPTAFPIAFAVSDDLLSLELSPDDSRGIYDQNRLLNSICGEEANVFGRMEPSELIKENAEPESDTDSWTGQYFRRLDGNEPVKFTWTYNVPDEMPVYLESNFHEGAIVVNGTNNIDVSADKFKCLGSFPAGTTLTVEYNVSDIDIGSYGLELYRFDLGKWNEIYENVKNSGIDVTSFKNTHIKGGINLQEPATVLSTIPQDGGWKVYVDGKRVKDFKALGALTAFNVGAGNHTIELKYSVPGFAFGMLITLLSLLALAFCYKVRRKGGKGLLKKQDKPFEKKEKTPAQKENKDPEKKSPEDNAGDLPDEESKEEENVSPQSSQEIKEERNE